MTTATQDKPEIVAGIQDENFGDPETVADCTEVGNLEEAVVHSIRRLAPGNKVEFGNVIASEPPPLPSYRLDKYPGSAEEKVDTEQGYVNLIIATNLALFGVVWTECCTEIRQREPGWRQTLDFIGLWCPSILAAATCVVGAFVVAAMLIGVCFVDWLVIKLITTSVAIVRRLSRFTKTTVSKSS